MLKACKRILVNYGKFLQKILKSIYKYIRKLLKGNIYQNVKTATRSSDRLPVLTLI